MIVADTSLIVHLLLPGNGSAEAEAVFLADPAWAAPRLWRSELRNVLATRQRAGLLDLDQALAIMDDATRLMEGREYEIPSGPVLRAAADSECTAYDCEFVVLARDIGAPLVTTDGQLLQAFQDLAVSPQEFATGSDRRVT